MSEKIVIEISPEISLMPKNAQEIADRKIICDSPDVSSFFLDYKEAIANTTNPAFTDYNVWKNYFSYEEDGSIKNGCCCVHAAFEKLNPKAISDHILKAITSYLESTEKPE